MNNRKRPTHPLSADLSHPIKKAKKAKHDPNWTQSSHKGKKSRASDTVYNEKNLYKLRTDTRQSYTDDAGNTIPIKTSIMIDEAVLSQNKYNTDQFETNYFSKINTVAEFRPPYQVTEISINGSPEKIITPIKKTPLSRVKRVSQLNFFSNDPGLVPYKDTQILTSLDEMETFTASTAYKSVQKPIASVKVQNEVVTEASLKKAKQENVGAKNRSQNKVMVNDKVNAKLGSATLYAQSTKAFPLDAKFEWAHLKPHKAHGEASQQSNNLALARDHTNTDQLIFTESQYDLLAKSYPSGFTAINKATLIDDTQITTTIEKEIETPDFKISHEFNAQDPNKSHISYHHYYKHFIETLVEEKQSKPHAQPAASNQPAKTTLAPTFFNKDNLKQKMAREKIDTPDNSTSVNPKKSSS